MKQAYNVAVVIPFYRDAILHYEEISLQQCENVLSGYSKIAIKPHSLVLPDIIEKYNFSEVISFEDKYFNGVQGYNGLMLSDIFYSKFLKYDYILIYQMDAFVFKDDLIYWCEQGFDYVGAPWLRKKNDSILKEILYKALFEIYTRLDIKKNNLPSRKQFDNKVGNGGFSLRKVSKFHELTLSLRPKISLYLGRNEHEFHEDAFWSIEVNRRKKLLNIPPYKIGLKFSIENAPFRALKLNNEQLPFGCHAWDKHLDFWRPIFRQYGYII
jgi:hypothetical protein